MSSLEEAFINFTLREANNSKNFNVTDLGEAPKSFFNVSEVKLLPQIKCTI